MLPSWVRRMTRAEVRQSVDLARSHTLDELMALAIVRHRKDVRIGLWVMASCIVGLFAGMYLMVGMAAALKTHPAVWCLGFFASMFLPLPIMAYGRAGHREGRIIALAYHLKKDPRFPGNIKE
jgi:hypothetical protein